MFNTVLQLIIINLEIPPDQINSVAHIMQPFLLRLLERTSKNRLTLLKCTSKMPPCRKKSRKNTLFTLFLNIFCSYQRVPTGNPSQKRTSKTPHYYQSILQYLFQQSKSKTLITKPMLTKRNSHTNEI